MPASSITALGSTWNRRRNVGSVDSLTNNSAAVDLPMESSSPRPPRARSEERRLVGSEQETATRRCVVATQVAPELLRAAAGEDLPLRTFNARLVHYRPRINLEPAAQHRIGG